MFSFIEYIIESENGIKPAHEHLNKKQMNSLNKHPTFRTYIRQPYKGVYARPDSNDEGPGKHTRNFVVSSGGKHRLHIAMTHHGKILGHSLYHKNVGDDGTVSWNHIKSEDGK